MIVTNLNGILLVSESNCFKNYLLNCVDLEKTKNQKPKTKTDYTVHVPFCSLNCDIW